MEVRQLELLVAAVTHGSLREAAERSGISQPGLTMSLQRLEDSVGATLLERGRRGVRPTPQGEALVRHARIVLAHLRHAQGEIDALSGRQAGPLRIGVGASFMNRALPRAVAALLEREESFTLHVTEGVAETQLPALREGELDLVLVRFPGLPPDTELVYEVLHQRRLRACVRRGHPLARKRKRSLEDFGAFPWVIPDDVPAEIAAPIYRELRRQGRSLDPAVQTNSVSFLKRLLVASDSVGLLPEGAVADEVSDRVLVALPMPGIALDDEVGAVYRKELADAPALQEIVAALREELPRLGLVSA